VIGASGLVGSALIRELKRRDNCEAVGTFWSNPNAGTAKMFLDVNNAAHVDKIISSLAPTIIWLPAYFTNVDYAKQGEDTNIEGMKNVIRSAESAYARLVFYSSSYVFDGNGKLPYRTT